MSHLQKIVIALIAVMLGAGYVWNTHRVVSPGQATWDDVRTEARHGGYQIISTDDLSKRYIKQPDASLMVDTRQKWEYRTGHIKGAVNFPMEPTWLARWRNKGALKKFLGPDKNRHIVFY